MKEQSAKTSVARVLPVLFGFFIMGFIDIVGFSTSYVQEAFGVSEKQASVIPSLGFFWFILSIPTALLMSKIGRKNTVQLSNLITIVGMFLPVVFYNFTSVSIAFAMLGIGNMMIQTSLNPLLTNVVKGDSLSSTLTTGQLIKAVSSFCGPFIGKFAIMAFGNWNYMFLVFGGLTLLSALWLMATPIKEEAADKTASLGAALGLLGNRIVLLCFLGIIFVVGVDVGMNYIAPKLLIERVGLSPENAGLGSSAYFLCRTIGALVGAVLLTKMTDMKYYRLHIWVAIAAMVVLYFMQGQWAILAMIGVVGYACSSMFSVIFSQAMKARPDMANEVSGLMVTGIVGGAIVAPLMAWMTQDVVGNQMGSLIVISVCLLYLLLFSFMVKTKN